MLRVADRQQGLFDAAWCLALLPEESIYALLAEHGDRIARDQDFADCYSERHGRPSIPPSLLAKVLLLAYRDGLSDERAMDAVRFDLRWKVALDLPVDHPGFHPTSLVRFRARLLLHGKERLVFERSLELATELGLLSGPAEQRARKTPSRQFTGYKLHAAAASEAPILTAIVVSAGNEHDGHHAGALIDQQQEGMRPQRVIGDTAYGNVEARELLEQRQVSVLAPVHSSSPKEGTIPKDQFKIDLENHTVTCPQGNTTPIYKPRANRRTTSGERVARFAREHCEPCPLRPR